MIIYLREFLDQCLQNGIGPVLFPYAVISFVGSEKNSYPLLFFSLFFQKCKEDGIYVDFSYREDKKNINVLAQSAISGAGAYKLYWLGEYSLAQQENSSICDYRVPEKIALYLHEEKYVKDTADRLIIRISDTTDRQTFLIVAQFLFSLSDAYDSLIDLFYQRYKHLSLEQACVLFRYMYLMPPDEHEWISDIADELFTQDHTRYALSQHLLVKNKSAFFQEWKVLSPRYSAQFWCTFWSEQLWKAYWYVLFMTEKNMQAARAIGNRLPFSFLRKEWQLVSTEELKKAHAMITDIDFNLKNGGDEGIFDLFYAQFMSGF